MRGARPVPAYSTSGLDQHNTNPVPMDQIR
jgi:hypothetical protein